MSCDGGARCYPPVFWASSSRVRSLWPWGSLPWVLFPILPFLFVKRSYYAEQPWYAAAKIHIPENECLVSHCGDYWLDISLAWKPYTVAYHIKGHTPHTSHSLLSVCILTHWHQSLYCFNPIQYDAELSFTTTHSLTITPYSSNLPAGPL